jgi:hypothetical protein
MDALALGAVEEAGSRVVDVADMKVGERHKQLLGKLIISFRRRPSMILNVLHPSNSANLWATGVNCFVFTFLLCSHCWTTFSLCCVHIGLKRSIRALKKNLLWDTQRQDASTQAL